MSLFIRYLLIVAPYHARRRRARPFNLLIERDLRIASQAANDDWLFPEGFPASSPSTVIGLFSYQERASGRCSANSDTEAVVALTVVMRRRRPDGAAHSSPRLSV